MTVERESQTTRFSIATSVLQDIVRSAVSGDSRLRVHQSGMMRGRGIEVNVEGDACRVALSLDARFGQDLQALGAEVQQAVAEAMSTMTGLSVEAVDITFCSVYPSPAGE